MKPGQALTGVPGFEAAVLKGILSAGAASDSFLVEMAGIRYVLRVDKPLAADLGLNRTIEARITAAMAVEGIGPQLAYSDPHAGILLTRFIPGRTWSRSDVASTENLSRLARLLKRLHCQTPLGEPFALRATLTNYSKLVGSGESQELVEQADILLRRLSADRSRLCLCHNDVTSANIVDGGGLYLIDWEYAAIGDPIFDLATVIRHHGLSEEQAEQLLCAYLDVVTDVDRTHLQRYCRLYDRVLALWLLAVDQAGPLDIEQLRQLEIARARIASGPLL